MNGAVWVPESASIPGYYAAIHPTRVGDGNLVAYGTYNVHAAHQFATEAECSAWCDWWNASRIIEGYAGIFRPVCLEAA